MPCAPGTVYSQDACKCDDATKVITQGKSKFDLLLSKHKQQILVKTGNVMSYWGLINAEYAFSFRMFSSASYPEREQITVLTENTVASVESQTIQGVY